MNILITPLPDAVEIDGEPVPIDTDFRTALRVILAFEDATLTMAEKQGILLENLYSAIPANVARAVAQGVKFLNGGEPPSDGESGLRVYSFEQDSRLIFAAFRQTHGIDLEAVEVMHWWKFLALFMDLGSDTAFCHLIGLRKRIKTGKASEDEQAMYREMRDLVDLDEPDTRTPEEHEIEAAFLEQVYAGEAARRERRRQQKEQDG
jgi:hypothetical protein